MQGAQGREINGIWREEYRIRSYEADAKGEASLPTLCNLMQEAAWNHAEHLGTGYSHLREEGLIWVLSRMQVRIHRYPRWGELIVVHTWPSGLDRVFALRDFQILDEAKEIIGAATGAWLILDAKHRRLQRVEPILAGIRRLPDRRALGEGWEIIPAPRNPRSQVFFPIRLTDLDMHGHVNHVRYIGWILDSCPLKMHERQRISFLQIQFLAESTYSDEVSVLNEEVEGAQSSYLHSLVRKGDHKEVCRARTTWEPQNA